MAPDASRCGVGESDVSPPAVAAGKPMRIAAYTGGRDVPSARFRVRQYIEAMPRYGIELIEFAAHVGTYPPTVAWRRPAWLIAALAERGLQAACSHHYDAVLFQRELISTMQTAEPLFGRPRLLDVDDAIWAHRRGRFAGKLAARCDTVICGNNFLAEYFGQYCKRIVVLPTAVDTRRFVPSPRLGFPTQIIGWSGTRGHLDELQLIEPALCVVMHRFPESRLRVVCDLRPDLASLPVDRVDFVRWSPTIEVSALQDLRVGLMPLRDTAIARGKCAFKMLTYMACGVPVVVSSVGMNREVLAMGNVGFGARDLDEWVDALSALLDDAELSAQTGAEGRKVIEQAFSLEALAPKLAAIFKTMRG